MLNLKFGVSKSPTFHKLTVTSNTQKMSKEKEFRVIIPEEEYQIIEFKQEDLPGIGVINLSLVRFEPKEVFSWHCSIMIEFENFIENGMPTNENVLKAEKFED